MALDRMVVRGGNPLRGEIPISGAKNAALPILAASLLTSSSCRIRNVPRLQDVETMCGILRVLGARVETEGDSLHVRAEDLTGSEAPYDFVRKMRASILLLGPLVARSGFARVSLPGGCAIGVRPIDLHLKVLQALGADIALVEGYVEAKAARLRGAGYSFEKVTVTGTVNAMMAAARAEGTTTLANCACEPEIPAVAEALRQMGARVEGDGTPTIRVDGAARLAGFDVSLIPDRIETGTYLVAGAVTQGDLFLRSARGSDCKAVLAKIRETGAEITEEAGGLRVRGRRPIRPARVETAPFPGFPTDMQAQLTVLLCLARGESLVTEHIFENRFMHVAELARMGADLKIRDATVTVTGVAGLRGAPVMATDLRASASLVLAGLAAEGTTEVLRIYHLDRGYENMDAKLRAVGADIARVRE
jgi:UDP-N-acetylglucosamine 1-carboxyvinyltransferase